MGTLLEGTSVTNVMGPEKYYLNFMRPEKYYLNFRVDHVHFLNKRVSKKQKASTVTHLSSHKKYGSPTFS